MDAQNFMMEILMIIQVTIMNVQCKSDCDKYKRMKFEF